MSRRRRRGGRRGHSFAIDVMPLVDMVFILLIFFIVTTSFVKESGVEIERPTAQTAQAMEKNFMMLEIAPSGDLYADGQKITFDNIRSRLHRFMVESPGGAVIIVADRSVDTGTTIRVLDECRVAGIQNISVAAKKP